MTGNIQRPEDEEQVQDGTLVANNLYPTGVPSTSPNGVDSSAVGPSGEVQETNVGFPGPQRNTTSQVDLSIPENKALMDEEHNIWWNMPIRVDGELNQERLVKKDLWYQKYHGINLDQLKERNRTQGGFYPGANNLAGNLQNTFQGLSVPGMAWADFGMDVVGLLPGAAPLDDIWDESTKLDNPIHQNVRRVLSVVLPSIHGGGLAYNTIGKLPLANMTKLQKVAASVGIVTAVDTAIIGVSDTSEEDNLAGIMAQSFPGVFGSEGILPFPDWYKTLDSDSPSVRRWKNMYENTVFNFMGTILGGYISAVKTSKGQSPTMGWFEPKDELSKVYKVKEISKMSDPDKLIEIQNINTILTTKKLSRKVETELVNELENLKAQLGGVDNIDDALRQAEDSQIIEEGIAAKRELEVNPNSTSFDPDVTPVLQDNANARQTVPPGNVARNMADTTAIKKGISEGDPAPVITESMRTKGLMVGSTSRDAVMGVAVEAGEIGRFNALVDGFRFTTKQMNAAAWDIYTSIIAAENMDDLRGLFIADKDVKNMLMGKFKVEYINEEQARAAAFGLRDLTDRYLGRSIAQSSARVMDTLGREASTIAKAVTEIAPFSNEARAMDLIIDKMQFLLDEYALNKYISGWSLRNKNWFDQVPPKDLDSVIDTLTKEFKSAENAIHAKNLRFTNTLKELAETNPMLMRPLMDAFAHTNGDVDTITKLMKWVGDLVTPMGMLKSPDPKEMNLFTKGLWGVVMNNVLSGKAAVNATKGNAYDLIVKPITGIMGGTAWGFTDNFEGLKRTFFYHSAVWETNRRALKDAWTMVKKAHKDPELMLKQYRKDMVLPSQDSRWDILDDMRPALEAEGNIGKVAQIDAAIALRDLAKHPAMRYGMTALVFPDVYASTMVAHYLSRMRAYDDVFSEFGFIDPLKLVEAEKRHMKTMFAADGTMKDEALKALVGEISLNLDDGLAAWINKATTAYPIARHQMMFPRTQSNALRKAASWTPISLIPGINKYSKTIWARNDDEIAAALAEHGIDMASTPNARVLFEQLRNEYTGRIMLTGLMVKNLHDYAMAGNIRGNGHYNASRRNKERDQMGYIPKTINIGGKWVSYEGLIGVEQVLATIGDLAYYANDIEEPFLEDWTAKLSYSLAASFLQQSILTSMEPIVAASTGDLSGWNRAVAQMLRSYIPLSSGLGVLSQMIDSAQKDINREIHEYLLKRVPVLSLMLTDANDIWTGEKVNDLGNPYLRVFNAVSPFKISGTAEPWRIWLQEIGFNGLSKLTRDSTGSYEYSIEERQLIYKYIGEQQLYKKVQKYMKDPAVLKQIKEMKVHRSTGNDLLNEKVKLEIDNLPIHRMLAKDLRTAQLIAEKRLLAERPDIANTILHQRYAKSQMKRGDVQGAIQTQEDELKTRQLLQMAK